MVDPRWCRGWESSGLIVGGWDCGVSRGVACNVALFLLPVADVDGRVGIGGVDAVV